MAQWSPSSRLAKVVDLAGFSYDPQKDIIFSEMDALQRKFGYAYGYDDSIFLINADIDCEPIFFDCHGKTWMIELWKGQYGLMTGCEIGVYNRSPNSSPIYSFLDATIGKREHDSNPSHNLFFDCASDNELLEMSFTLYRRGQEYLGRQRLAETLFSRGPEKHWWLTGFRWGELSNPDDLFMEVSIKFPSWEMHDAFVRALLDLGYQPTAVPAHPVTFTFDRPHSFQPRLNPARQSSLAEVRNDNASIVSRYKQLGLLSNDPNGITGDKEHVISDYITQYGPAFFARVLAELSKNASKTAQELLGVLLTRFGHAYDEATKAITNAGYTLSEWIGSLEEHLGLRMDFSCRVQVENAGNQYELVRENFGVSPGRDGNPCGQYIVNPPEKISPGGTGRFWIRDFPGVHGAEGWVGYYYIDSNRQKHSFRFFYGCPTGFDKNYAKAQPPFNAWLKEGNISSNWEKEAQQLLPGKKLHPLTVDFVWGQIARPRDN
jgi:Domain of unknown function (DUF4474)